MIVPFGKESHQRQSDGETYQWGATDKSVPEKNVLAGLSPDSGYPDENGE